MFYFLIQYSRVYYAAFLQRGVDSVVYLTCSRWGNNSHILKTFIWTVLLLVHNKIFCWKFGVFPAHYIDHIFFTAKTCWIWIALPCWRVHGSAMVEAFPQVRTKPISPIASLVVTMIQPIHGMLLFCWSQCHPNIIQSLTGMLEDTKHEG